MKEDSRSHKQESRAATRSAASTVPEQARAEARTENRTAARAKNLEFTQVRAFARAELSGWSAGEAAWLLLTCLATAGLSIWWGESPLGIVAAVAGIAYVVFSGLGKLSAYAFGLVNVLAYSHMALQASYYGEVALNLLCYLPLLAVGFATWSRNMNEQTGEVKKRSLGPGRTAALLAVALAATAALGWVLQLLGGALPFADALTTALSVLAMALSVGRYLEQWALWIVVDAVTVGMWAAAFTAGTESLAMLLMWSIYLVNGIVMLTRWAREVRSNATS